MRSSAVGGLETAGTEVVGGSVVDGEEVGGLEAAGTEVVGGNVVAGNVVGGEPGSVTSRSSERSHSSGSEVMAA